MRAAAVIPGVLSARGRRKGRVAAAHQHDGPRLVGGDDASGDPGLAVQCQQRGGGGQGLVGRCGLQRHVVLLLPEFFGRQRVGDPTAQLAQVGVRRNRRQRRDQPGLGRHRRGCGHRHDARLGGDGGWWGWDPGTACAATAGEQRSRGHHGGHDRQDGCPHDQVRSRPPPSGTHTSPDFFGPILPNESLH